MRSGQTNPRPKSPIQIAANGNASTSHVPRPQRPDLLQTHHAIKKRKPSTRDESGGDEMPADAINVKDDELIYLRSARRRYRPLLNDSDLERKRQALLQRPDWLGLSMARPLRMKFATVQEHERVGKRRKLNHVDLDRLHEIQQKINMRSERRNADVGQQSSSPFRRDRDQISIRMGNVIHHTQRTMTTMPPTINPSTSTGVRHAVLSSSASNRRSDEPSPSMQWSTRNHGRTSSVDHSRYRAGSARLASDREAGDEPSFHSALGRHRPHLNGSSVEWEGSALARDGRSTGEDSSRSVYDDLPTTYERRDGYGLQGDRWDGSNNDSPVVVASSSTDRSVTASTGNLVEDRLQDATYSDGRKPVRAGWDQDRTVETDDEKLWRGFLQVASSSDLRIRREESVCRSGDARSASAPTDFEGFDDELGLMRGVVAVSVGDGVVLDEGREVLASVVAEASLGVGLGLAADDDGDDDWGRNGEEVNLEFVDEVDGVEDDGVGDDDGREIHGADLESLNHVGADDELEIVEVDPLRVDTGAGSNPERADVIKTRNGNSGRGAAFSTDDPAIDVQTVTGAGDCITIDDADDEDSIWSRPVFDYDHGAEVVSTDEPVLVECPASSIAQASTTTPAMHCDSISTADSVIGQVGGSLQAVNRRDEVRNAMVVPSGPVRVLFRKPEPFGGGRGVDGVDGGVGRGGGGGELRVGGVDERWWSRMGGRRVTAWAGGNGDGAGEGEGGEMEDIED